MGYHLGRLIDHVGLRVDDFPAVRQFYLAVFEALGRASEVHDADEELSLDELYIGPRLDAGGVTANLHLCFQAPDRETVARVHAAGMAAGGRDNGGPGLRDYHPGYYAAFLLDPAGNNLEVKVDERVTGRSAEAVDVTTGS
jgi:catechol 2,3-dioxygenase-like lactoylglutathione lyase family enzyme